MEDLDRIVTIIVVNFSAELNPLIDLNIYNGQGNINQGMNEPRRPISKAIRIENLFLQESFRYLIFMTTLSLWPLFIEFSFLCK